MEQGKRYLIIELYDGKQKGDIREWQVLEIGQNAIKVQDLVESQNRWVLGAGIVKNKPFWILKTKIDKIGKSEYQIIEEL